MPFLRIEIVVPQLIKAQLNRMENAIMAIGAETKAALDELSVKIKAEADQRAAELIEALGADADTAAAIRAKFGEVAAIVPDPEVPGEPETPAEPA